MQKDILNLMRIQMELESLKEYHYDGHSSRILSVSNCSKSKLKEVENFVKGKNSFRNIFSDCFEDYGFVIVSFYDVRDSLETKEDLVAWGLNVTFCVPKDVLDDEEQNQGTIVLFNVDKSISKKEINKFFSKFGEIKEIRETPNKKNHKFIEYFDLRNAREALKKVHNKTVFNRKIKIEPSRPGGIRQQLLIQAAKEMNFPESLIGLPPPEDMLTFIDKYLKNRNKKEEKLFSSLPKPTEIGEELSNKPLEDPPMQIKHEPETVFEIGIKGEDLEASKTVFCIENIPNCVNRFELIKDLENYVSCFYDQFFCIQQDNNTYTAVIRVTNVIVERCLKESFNELVYKYSPWKICKIHEITTQGKNFTDSIVSLLA